MTTKKRLFAFLDGSKGKVETAIDESAIRVCGIKYLRSVVKDSESLNFIFEITSSTVDDVISFLLEKSHLRKVKFVTPRVDAHSGDVVHRFRCMSSTESGPCRPLIPLMSSSERSEATLVNTL